MSEQRPEAVWVFPEKKKRGPRTALIVLMVVLVLIVAGVVALFLIPRGGEAPAPTATPSDSPSPSLSPTPSLSPSAPVTTPPPPADPDLSAFRDQVGFRLTTANEGLDLIARGDDPQGTISKLQGDAQRLADAPPPSSIEQDWSTAVQEYMAALDALSRNPADSAALENARSAVSVLSTLLNP